VIRVPFPTRPSQHEMPTAIVLDGDQRSALATVRSLGRRGVRVLVAGAGADCIAATSRYCAARLVSPDPDADAAKFLGWLHSLASSFPDAILMPMGDRTTELAIRARDDGLTLRTALPSHDSYSVASDKLALARLADDLRIRAPRTFLVARTDRPHFRAPDLCFPVVVKPRVSAVRSRTTNSKLAVQYANDPEQLQEILCHFQGEPGIDLLVQEYISGGGAGVFLFYEKGRHRFSFAHRRLREKPPTGGVSVLSESASPNPRLLAAAKTLLDRLAWHGVAMVEFKVDRAGEPWLESTVVSGAHCS
jgi:predicted ATP-grasp superfamily ATP-dependent carboligase